VEPPTRPEPPTTRTLRAREVRVCRRNSSAVEARRGVILIIIIVFVAVFVGCGVEGTSY